MQVNYNQADSVLTCAAHSAPSAAHFILANTEVVLLSFIVGVRAT